MPAPIKVIKSKILTTVFQKYIQNKDIRIFKGKFLYYLFFRLVRKFLVFDIIIKIYNFKVYGSIDKNKTSYFLLRKCEFGDSHELEIIRKFSIKNKILLIDCGCNYGFYSLYAASLSKKNLIFSIEASKKTSKEFLRNLELNDFQNVILENFAISNIDNHEILFNESLNDWESSQTHNDFKNYSTTKVNTLKIDTLVKKIDLSKYTPILKLDIEGNEINAIKGATNFIEITSPLIIMEISKFVFDNKENIDYLKNFLHNFDYSIYNIDKKKQNIEEILIKLKKLNKKHKTIGNYYLIRNSSKILKEFISYE